MPNEGISDFDADLNAMLNGSDAPAATPTDSMRGQEPVAEAAELKFGGRVWKSAEDIGRAYEAMQRDYTKKTQEYSRLKPYGDFDAYLNKHPELRNKFNEVWTAQVQEYQKRLNAGQSEATAQRATGVSPEIVERLEAIEAHFESQKVQSEVADIKQKFGLDKGTMDAVLSKAIELEEKGISLPLSDVYKLHAFESKQLEAKKTGEKTAIERMNAKRKANVGGSELPSATPSAKGISEMNGSEYSKALEDRLNQLGFSG